MRRLAWGVLAAFYLAALFPDFLSPYSPNHQFRDLPYARPGVYGAASVQWLAQGDPYRWLGVVPASLRLATSADPGRFFPLGTDEFGRDWFSRLCHGASISLFLAPAAAFLSVVIAVGLGAFAGFRGGWADALVMKTSELFVILPWFYVLIALRAALPLSLSAPLTMAIVFGLLGILGWAAPARFFRGLVMSLKARDFIHAARAGGASTSRVLGAHVLPFLLPSVWTQFLLILPAYIITEVTLSFLGLGVAEPAPTWGGMLVPLQQYSVLTSYPWMFAPAIAIIVVCLAFQILAHRV